jgi:hypothetical protein
MKSARFSIQHFVFVNIIVGLWVNASEVFRYFVVVMPAIRAYLPMVPDIAPMNPGVFAVWAVWDTVLVLFNVTITWLYAERFGYSWRSALIAGTIGWLVFPLLWIALINISLASPMMMMQALPLAWIEFVVASGIGIWLFRRYARQSGCI